MPAVLVLLVLGLSATLWAGLAQAETVLLERGATMSYLVNTSDPGVDLDWMLPEFVEGPGWSGGAYGVGYDQAPPGSGAHALIETEIPGPVNSVYTRTTFEITDAGSVFSVFLGQDYDDGLVAWINGVEVYRSPEMRDLPVAWDTVARSHESSNGTSPDYEPLRDISASALPVLEAGVNVLAVGVWNNTGSLDDMVLVPQLVVNRMLTRSPYLQQATHQSIVVRWRTGTSADSRVLVGTEPGNPTNEVTLAGSRTEHEITLSGLMPDTRYYYAVGTADEILAGGDAAHFFDTPPAPGTPHPTRIWVLGDSGQGNESAVAVREAYLGFADDGAEPSVADLILMLGDNAYPKGTDIEHQYNLFDIFSEQLRQSVLWTTIGNHDVYDEATGTWPYYDIFNLPQQAEAGGVASSTESYYSFDYGNIHFVVLDSMDVLGSEFGNAMLAWLEADLADVTEDWLVAIWHHPPYSKGSHDSDDPSDSGGRLIWMRENVVPVLEDYGIDLVLTGHSHSYERSYLIDGHYGDSASFDESMKQDPGDGNENGGDGAYIKPYRGEVPYESDGDGAVYAVAGNASQLSPGIGEGLGGTEADHPAMIVSILTLGSMVLDVNGNRLDGLLLDASGTVRDEFTIFKDAPTSVPEADFEASPRIAQAPATIDFTDLTLNGPTDWGWDLEDDGTPDSTVQHPTFELVEPGLHSMRLTVANSAGSDAKLKQTYVCVTAGPLGAIDGLRFDASPSVLFWNQGYGATAYDVVRGKLNALVAGDLASIELTCLENDDTDLQAQDGTTPLPGQAFFYLAGGANCAGEQGTYDSSGPGHPVSRDAFVQPVCTSCTTGTDDDDDAVCAEDDNCPAVPNPDQQDDDDDGVGDGCDGCPFDPDKTEPGLCGCEEPDTDSDGDGAPDCDDECPGDPAKVEPGECGCGVADTDGDDDGTPDCNDECPQDPEKDEPGLCGCGVSDADTDDDGTPDCDDDCPQDPEKVEPGLCGCGVSDTDADHDGTPDCDDGCPQDPDKVDPGVCGCGVAETDTDDDGAPDCVDECPEDPDKVEPGQCGCGISDFDSDNDFTPDCLDECPFDANKTEPGLCGCGTPDTDTDSDGTPNCFDECPTDPNKTEPGLCGCGEPDVDSDFDGTLDCNDGCPADPNKTAPGFCGCGDNECWIQLGAGTLRDLEAVTFPVSAQTGYIVGEQGIILKTLNGGIQWQQQNSTTASDLEAVVFPADNSTGYAVGDFGRILRTTNGGQNWIQMSSGTLADLRGVDFIAGTSVGYAVGDGGTILKTTDSGVTWFSQFSPTLADLESVHFPANALTGYAVGSDGTILKTSNGGFSWSKQTSETLARLEDVFFPEDNLTGYITGAGGTLLKTTTGGSVWSPQNPSTSSTLRGISFPKDALAGYVVGSGGVIRKTTDGGQNWLPDDQVVNSTLRDVAIPVDETSGYIVGSTGMILKRVVE